MSQETWQNMVFVDATAENFKCAVCLNTVVRATQACKNQHFFCETCLEDVCAKTEPSCPTCRDPVLGVHGYRARFVDEIVDNLLIKCPHGCGAQYKLKERREHNDVCPEMLIDCPYKGCGCFVKLPRKCMANHLAENALEHAKLHNEAVHETMFNAKESADRARELVRESYTKMGSTMTRSFELLIKENNGMRKELGDLAANVSALTGVVGSLASFVADAQVNMASALAGKGQADFVHAMKRKASEMKESVSSKTPPSKKRCPSPPPPGAPQRAAAMAFSFMDSLGSSTTSMPQLPRLAPDRGMFDGVAVDELDGAGGSGFGDRRNGGSWSPTSPSYSPTSPQYQPGSVFETTSPRYEP